MCVRDCKCVCVFSWHALSAQLVENLKGLVPQRLNEFRRQLPATAMGRRVAFVLEGSRGDIQPLRGDPIHGSGWDGFGGTSFFGGWIQMVAWGGWHLFGCRYMVAALSLKKAGYTVLLLGPSDVAATWGSRFSESYRYCYCLFVEFKSLHLVYIAHCK